MPSKGLTRAEVRELRDQLAALLLEVDEGGIEASAGMRYRIEGAVHALAVATGVRVTLDDADAVAAQRR